MDENFIREYMVFKIVFDLLKKLSCKGSEEFYRRIRAGSDIFALYKYVKEATFILKG